MNQLGRDSQILYIFHFRRRVLKASAVIAGSVCFVAWGLGFPSTALGFAIGAAASIVGFCFAVKRSLRLLAIRSPKQAAAFAWASFLPRYLLYAIALWVGASYPAASFAAVAVGVFICNLVVAAYEPVICRLWPEGDAGVHASLTTEGHSRP